MEKVLSEKEKESVKQQILLTAVELLAERGLMDSREKNRIKSRLAYEEVYLNSGKSRDL